MSGNEFPGSDPAHTVLSFGYRKAEHPTNRAGKLPILDVKGAVPKAAGTGCDKINLV